MKELLRMEFDIKDLGVAKTILCIEDPYGLGEDSLMVVLEELSWEDCRYLWHEKF